MSFGLRKKIYLLVVSTIPFKYRNVFKGYDLTRDQVIINVQ